MQRKKTEIRTVAEYLRAFPPRVQKLLGGLRRAVKAAAPEAQERISYRMPAFWLQGNLVYFAAFKKHIGFYPTASGMQAFKKELTGYKTSKGAVQFPLDRPLPLAVISKIVKFRAAENLRRAREKLKKRSPIP